MKTSEISKKARIQDPEEIIERALKAYFKRAEKNGLHVMQPSKDCCVVDQKYCYIRNNSSVLAKYNHIKKKFVRTNQKDREMEV